MVINPTFSLPAQGRKMPQKLAGCKQLTREPPKSIAKCRGIWPDPGGCNCHNRFYRNPFTFPHRLMLKLYLVLLTRSLFCEQ